MRRLSNRIAAVAVFLFLPFMSGCTPEKARQLKTAAVQFGMEARDAIAAVRGLMDAEIASQERTDAQKADQFAANILAQSTSTKVNADLMEWAIDPNAVKLSPTESAARDALIGELEQQYSDFTGMFENLERGSLLAKNSVPKVKQYAAKLTAQMAGIAKVTAENPLRLVQHRTAVLVQIERIRRDSSLSSDQKRQALSDQMSRWLAVKSQEEELKRAVVGKCLVAASAGQAVLQLADSYGRLSTDDISRLLTQTLTLSQELAGKSLADMQTRNEKVMSFLNSNAVYKTIADDALAKVQSRLVSQK